ncbi:hypothetical protein BKA67DRAFT_658741 [Truncatella angustata]|uniref:MIF4G domain-containing protein n=1 Tax=Truncatella angustata TaxID=152316 RepID=A0A9P8UKY4_9PEZI|nr:uncharacterized protein BKA67DRAFT_658741 [Truncatella angustata]KAH6654445.1 hypothetical protein BKA67DRAFT_658741 [Truncatella angustata]
MTSTPTTANANNVSNGPSYASAASAPKKQSAPVVTGGPSASSLASGTSQHAKSNSVSPVNDKPIMPAVPTVAPAVVVGTNGDSHSRKPSVTMSTPNNYAANGAAGGPKIQFGFQASPAVSHSTPQAGSAPIAIPGANSQQQRVPSPQNSPSPIPQPSASGGRPPSGAQSGQQLTFGSFGGNGDSHMRRTSAASQNPSHIRNESSQSANDPNNQGGHQGGPPNRGGYPQAGRGRGGYNPNYNNHNQMGYPPNGTPPFRPGHPAQGRGGMAPNFQPRNSYGPGTPPMGRASPALANAMPVPGAAPYYYQPPTMGGPMPNVTSPPSGYFDYTKHKQNKRKSQRSSGSSRDVEKSSNNRHRSQSNSFARDGGIFWRQNKRSDYRHFQDLLPPDPRQNGQLPAGRGELPEKNLPSVPPLLSLPHPSSQPIQNLADLDMSPASGNFERVLTELRPQQPYYPPGAQYDPRFGPNPYMYPPGGQPHSPAPHFQTPYSGPPQPFVPQPMSRNPSQASEPRPTSSTSQAQGSQGPSQQVPSQISKQPVVAASPQFARPVKKSAAITIRNANGEVVDIPSLKAPASPAPSTQSKTPPVVASTPPPPPKSATPKAAAPAHTRTDSTATKTQAEVQNEFKAKIAKQMAEEKAKGDQSKAVEGKAAADKAAADKAAADKATADKAAEDKAAAEKAADEKAAAEKKAADEKAAAEKKVADEKAAAEKKAADEKAAEEARAAEAKAKEEERLKAEQKADEEKKAAEEAKAKEAAEAKPDAPAPADEEDEIEKMIREMEEADAKREAEQAEISRQKKIAADAKKAAEEEAKKAAGSDDKLKEAEREAERLEEEKERKRREAEGKPSQSASDALSSKLSNMTISEKDGAESTSKPANLTINDKPVAGAKVSPGEKRGTKPAPLNLNTNVGVEPPQPSAALQSLKTARLLKTQQLLAMEYPEGVSSPNPALNPTASKKGTSFKYDPSFLLQFQGVFTEKPSLEFSQQVKTLIGEGDGGRSASARTPAGSGRQNSRTGTGAFSMGNFGAPTKTLPPGTTSAERFAMAQGQMARPPIGSMNSFRGPGGAFPSGNMMSRTPSSSMAPNSPRTASSRRGASKRNNFQDSKNEEKAAKTMPLTAGMKFDALQTSQTGWKPMSLTQKPSAPAPNALMDPPTVQRKVKAALNKMTPDNFDKISQQILDIAAQSKEETDGRTLRQVIQLTFEKATDEAHWASMYAKFAKRMLETMSPEVRDENIKDKNGQVVSGGALFRKYLLNRCQEEFERGWKTQLPETQEGDSKEAALMSEEYYKEAAAKRRGLGLVQFIGELYKLSMLTERIMHECVRKLVDYQGVPDEAEVESLSKLLRTIGGNLDATDKGHVMMDAYFQRIQSMVDFPDIPSRLKFMLMDIIDLRRARWESKEQNKGPKTLDEVRIEAEAAAAQKAAENAKGNQRGGGRLTMGRGDARQFSSGYAQQAPNTVGMDDLRRLKGSATRSASQNISLGPTSMFSSRSNSGRRLGPGSSLTRGNEDSAASSRTGTPPTQSSTNAFSLLANMEDNHPTSPPSTAASPALAKVTPEAAAADKE